MKCIGVFKVIIYLDRVFAFENTSAIFTLNINTLSSDFIYKYLLSSTSLHDIK